MRQNCILWAFFSCRGRKSPSIWKYFSHKVCFYKGRWLTTVVFMGPVFIKYRLLHHCVPGHRKNCTLLAFSERFWRFRMGEHYTYLFYVTEKQRFFCRPKKSREWSRREECFTDLTSLKPKVKLQSIHLELLSNLNECPFIFRAFQWKWEEIGI